MAPTGGTSTALLFLAILSLFSKLSYGLHCLVVRPGYGLVSEKCSSEAVACRIRIDNHAIEFYEYSALYDRNQFVCVLKNEYGLVDKSGCVSKKSGRGVRCWCYGKSNCNSVENSKKLYEAFMSGDQERYQKTIDEIDGNDDSGLTEVGVLPSTFFFTSKKAETSSEMTTSAEETTTTTHPLTTRTTTTERATDGTTRTKVTKSTKATHYKGAIKLHEATEPPKQGITVKADSSKVNDSPRSHELAKSGPYMRYGIHMKHEDGSTQGSMFSPVSIAPVLSKSGREEAHSHRLRQHEHKGVTKMSHSKFHKQTKMNTISRSVITVRPRTTTTATTTEEPTTKVTPPLPTTWPERASNDIVIPPDEPTDKKIHVIRVGPNDQYEHVIGSQEFSSIMQREALKPLPTDSTGSETDFTYEDDEDPMYEHDEQDLHHPIHIVDVSRIQKSINKGEEQEPMNEYFDNDALSGSSNLRIPTTSTIFGFSILFMFIRFFVV